MKFSDQVRRLADASVLEVLRDYRSTTHVYGDGSVNSPELLVTDGTQAKVSIVDIAVAEAIRAERIRLDYDRYTKTDPQETFYEHLPENVTPPDVTVTKSSEAAWENVANGTFPDGSTIGGQVLYFAQELTATGVDATEPDQAIYGTERSSIPNIATSTQMYDFTRELDEMETEDANYYRDGFDGAFATDEEREQAQELKLELFPHNSLTPKAIAEIKKHFRLIDERESKVDRSNRAYWLARIIEKLQVKRTR